jgi:hypothetical protein
MFLVHVRFFEHPSFICVTSSNIEEDKNEVQDYVKEMLFEKVVFVWNKGALQPGGVLHKDYLQNCRAKIAGSKLMNATDSEMEMYMNLL